MAELPQDVPESRRKGWLAKKLKNPPEISRPEGPN
jgi:hypothetical protein